MGTRVDKRDRQQDGDATDSVGKMPSETIRKACKEKLWVRLSLMTCPGTFELTLEQNWGEPQTLYILEFACENGATQVRRYRQAHYEPAE